MISKIVATGSIKIVMALTNNQPVARTAYLLRYVVPHSVHEEHSSGASLNSAWSWENQSNLHYGLQLLNAGKSPFSYRQGFINLLFYPNPCAFASSTVARGVSGPVAGVGSISYVYVGAVPGGATRTVTLNYRGT